MPTKASKPETLNYATVANVQALTPARKLGQGGNPSPADVQLYLELVESEINGILVERGYAVPVSEKESPQAFGMLRRIAIEGTVAQIEASAGNGPNIDRARKTYERSIERLEDARLVMDAAKNTERSKPRGPGVTTVAQQLSNTEYSAANPNAPLFRRGMTF